MSAECGCCGFPGLRPDGHAEWCEHTAAWLRDKHPVFGWTRAAMRRCGCFECLRVDALLKAASDAWFETVTAP